MNTLQQHHADWQAGLISDQDMAMYIELDRLEHLAHIEFECRTAVCRSNGNLEGGKYQISTPKELAEFMNNMADKAGQLLRDRELGGVWHQVDSNNKLWFIAIGPHGKILDETQLN
jgi:hypothetical protein